MTIFLSSYIHGVDRKGRVSVPAPFRAELSTHTRQTIVAYMAPDEPFLYVWGFDDFLKFSDTIKKLPPMSAERQRLARNILSAAKPLSFDPEGRIQLPETFMGQCGITDQALFAGQGEYFTLWNPATFEKRQTQDLEHYTADMLKLEEGWGK